jgi:hypothetical protein
VSETKNSAAVERRDSVAREPELLTDPVRRAEAEAANGLRQFDHGKAAANEAIERQKSHGHSFRLRPSLILALHREALAGISIFAGNYRPSTRNQRKQTSAAWRISRSGIGGRALRLRQRKLG